MDNYSDAQYLQALKYTGGNIDEAVEVLLSDMGA